VPTPIRAWVNLRRDMPDFSRLRGAAKPHLSGAAERLVVVGNERRRNRAERREARVEAACACLFVICAALLPRVFDVPSPPALPTLALILTFALLARVEFDVGAGITYPLQLAFVPALFVLPPAWAPLVVAAGLVLARLDTIVRHRNFGRQVLVTIGNSWFAFGPALVLTAGGVDSLSWEHWPLYVLALAAQFAGDTLAGVGREWLVLGVTPRLQLRLTGLVFLVDILLTPIGLLAALVAVDAPLAFLLVLPLGGLLRIFARERTARIDQAIELSAAYRGTAFLLGEVIAEDDAYTGEHSYGVIALSLQIADELGLDEDERRLVEFGALLHDVGKIAVPKEILNKPGPLDEDEWSVMRGHTIAGERMLNKVGGSMREIGAIVRASHERWDGNGYPDGTAGEDVPLPARIVAVADAFSAMTTTRPYRRAQSPELAIKELRECAGSQFDPLVVDALCAVLARPAPATATELFAETAYAEPTELRAVPDIGKMIDEQLGQRL
jgi:putative nucleotidyltransferase with HDIG domain